MIEGLANGLVALYIKIHHCTIDGVSGAEMTATLLDTSPAGARSRRPSEEWKPEAIPGELEMLGAGARRPRSARPHRAHRASRAGATSAAQSPRSGRWRAALGLDRLPLVGASCAARDDQVDAPPIPQTRAPHTPFNRSITPHRRWAFCSLPLADAKRMKSVFGTTLNDVVMAASAGALRRYLRAKGALPDEPLIGDGAGVGARAEQKTTYAIACRACSRTSPPTRRIR